MRTIIYNIKRLLSLDLNTKTIVIAENLGQKACEYLQERNVESEWNVRDHNKIFAINFYTLYVHMQHGGITQTVSKIVKPWSRRKIIINSVSWNTHVHDQTLSAIASNLTRYKKEYVLGGIFTEFDVKNRNERIYTATDRLKLLLL